VPDYATELIVREALSRHRVNNSGFVRANCSFCDTRVGKADRDYSFWVHHESLVYGCFKCHIKGKLDGGVAYVESEVEEPANTDPIELPEHCRPVTDKALSLESARAYLRKRGVDERLWGPLHIGACLRGSHYERVVIPLFDTEGVLFGWVARSWSGGKPPTLNSPGMVRGMFNEAALFVDTEEPVVVVEGVMDALTLYPHAVAVLGKPIENQIQMLCASKRPIAVALDGDARDESWALAERLSFEGKDAWFVALPPRADPNDLGREWIMQQVTEARA
jgi:hypothetical protein